MIKTNTRYVVRPGGRLRGDMRVPGDKSISHRAIILGSIAQGKTTVNGVLHGTDVLATVEAFRKMGVNITAPNGGTLSIEGVGLNGLSPPQGELDLGNSGTAMRLMAGLLAGQKFGTRLIGDESLSARPMRRVTDPLTQMGARVETGPQGTPPLTIHPVRGLNGIHYVLPVASAQVKSALLLAGLYAKGETCIEEPVPTRDHTERMLRGFGYACTHQGQGICINGAGALQGREIDVPADLSSAAFFIVAATIAENSMLRLLHVGVNPTRTGLLAILQKMGAVIRIERRREVCGEPVADLQVESARLTGIDVPREQITLAIDEIPILCVAAACADGVTTLRGAAELRHKESDRISCMVDGLRGVGIEVEEYADGMSIRGGDIRGGLVRSCGDHRIAMAFCMAGIKARSSIEIADCGSIATSFPDFFETARNSGVNIHAA